MNSVKSRIAAASVAFGVVALVAAAPAGVRAQRPAVDPEAAKLLRGMTDYMTSLKQFSVHAQNVFEDVLDSGHRVDHDFSASVLVSRPNKLRVDRRVGATETLYLYDGSSLTQHRPLEKVYATVAAPGTIEGMFDFARESLGLSMPLADLVYRNAFPLLMQDVTFATVVGKVDIGGVRCHHLLFSRPGVDFQVWVPEAGAPLPRKYVVTDTGTPERLSITTFMTDWNVTPTVDVARFTFAPPQGARAITFMRIDKNSGANR